MILKRLTELLAPGGKRAKLSILIYHRVLPQADPLSPDQITVDEFDLQMQVLASYFRVIPLQDAVQQLREGTLPSRSACITFDDGYADNAEHALPILQRHGLSATFFVATGFLNGGLMWNDAVIETMRTTQTDVLDLSQLSLGQHPVQGIEQRKNLIGFLLQKLKYLEPEERSEKVQAICEFAKAVLPTDLMMTTSQVCELSDAGMGIGAHTVNHPILTSVGKNVARDEIAQSKDDLEEIVGTPIDLFAYPNGAPGRDYSVETVQLVQDLGFRAAVSTVWGVSGPHADMYQLPRYTPWHKNPKKFTADLLRNCMRSKYEILPTT